MKEIKASGFYWKLCNEFNINLKSFRVIKNKNMSLFRKIINYPWNYVRECKETQIITLLEDKGSFKGILEFLKEKKEKNIKDFENYYEGGKGNLIEDISELTKYSKDDFYEFLIKAHVLDSLKLNNFKILREHNLLNIYKDFDTYFRGEIIQIHQIKNHKVIETVETVESENKNQFYSALNASTVYESLEKCLVIECIFKGTYSDTLFLLLDNI